jgi:hypothetical protein
MIPDLRFDPGPHLYTLNGEHVPSVTQVLSALYDFDFLPPWRRTEVLERGRVVHDAIDADNRRDLDDAAFNRLWPEHAGYVAAWRAFREARRFAPIFCEYRVASIRHHVAGTIDALGTLDGVAALIDYKTGDPGYVATDLQTAAYFGLAVEWANAGDTGLADFFKRYPIVRRFAVQLKPDGAFRVEAYTNPTDYRDFLTLAAAHHLIAGRRGRRPEAA